MEKQEQGIFTYPFEEQMEIATEEGIQGNGFIAEHGMVALVSALIGGALGAAGVGVPWYLETQSRKATLKQLKDAIAAIDSNLVGKVPAMVIIGDQEVASTELDMHNLTDLNRIINEHMFGETKKLRGKERQEWEGILINIARLGSRAYMEEHTASNKGKQQ